MNQLVTLSKRMQYFLKAKEWSQIFYVRDRNSQQKLLPTHHKMKQIALFLTMIKPTARIQPHPSKKYKVIPHSIDKDCGSVTYFR